VARLVHDSNLNKELLMMKPSIETTLRDLATRLPGASRRFHALGLDYCCGGARTLTVACAEQDLDPHTVLTEIMGADEAPDMVGWDERPPAELVDHIVTRYHRPLQGELPKLVAMAREVEAVHADKDTVPRGLANHLAMMERALDEHMQKEEQVLFPIVKAGGGWGAGPAIHVLTQEHDEHRFNLQRVRDLTGDLVPPDDACTTWRALYLRLHELERDLMEHVHLENHILFPLALATGNVNPDLPC